MRFISVASVALILFISVPSFAQEWIEYSNQRDFFGINFPSEPKVKDITYQTQYGITLPGHVYTAEEGPSKYSVTVIDWTNYKQKHADLVKSCKARGGEGDECTERSAIDMRGAKMPLSSAASGFVAAARIAIPNRLYRRNTASPTTTMGVRKSIAEYERVTTNVPTVKVGMPAGSGKRRPDWAVPLTACSKPSRKATSTGSRSVLVRRRRADR